MQQIDIARRIDHHAHESADSTPPLLSRRSAVMRRPSTATSSNEVCSSGCTPASSTMSSSTSLEHLRRVLDAVHRMAGGHDEGLVLARRAVAGQPRGRQPAITHRYKGEARLPLSIKRRQLTESIDPSSLVRSLC